MNDNSKNGTPKFNPITASSSVKGLPSEEIRLFSGHDKNVTRSASVNVVGSISRSDAISRMMLYLEKMQFQLLLDF